MKVCGTSMSLQARCEASISFQALAEEASAGFAATAALSACSFRAAASSSAGSSSASNCLRRTLIEFSIRFRNASVVRRGSSPVFEYWIMRPRSSAKRISQNGMKVVRWVSSCATVSSRSVLPGWPETNTASPGSAPSQLKRRRFGVFAGLPFS